MIFDWKVKVKLGNLTSVSNKVSKKMVIVTPPGLSTVQQKVVLLPLRTVPTKYNGFCPRLGPCRKSRSLKGPQRKLRVAKHVFEITSLKPRHFSEKKERIFLHRFPSNSTVHNRTTVHIKILKLDGKGRRKNTFGMFLMVNRYNSAFSVLDSLPLVQLKYSINSFSSQPETIHGLNRLPTPTS